MSRSSLYSTGRCRTYGVQLAAVDDHLGVGDAHGAADVGGVAAGSVWLRHAVRSMYGVRSRLMRRCRPLGAGAIALFAPRCRIWLGARCCRFQARGSSSSVIFIIVHTLALDRMTVPTDSMYIAIAVASRKCGQPT